MLALGARLWGSSELHLGGVLPFIRKALSPKTYERVEVRALTLDNKPKS